MAAVRVLPCVRWTSKIIAGRYLPLSEVKFHLVNLRACRIACSSHRLFSDTHTASGEGQTKMTESRNLLEVYQNKPSLLTGPRNVLKPRTQEDVLQELKRSRRLRLRTPVRIDPHKVGWTTGSKRVGTIGIKLGMSALWLNDGRREAVTLIQVSKHRLVANF